MLKEKHSNDFTENDLLTEKQNAVFFCKKKHCILLLQLSNKGGQN